MKPRHTLLLLLTLMLLVALYYGMQVSQIQRAWEAQIARKVFDFSPEEIQRLTIDRIDDTPAVAARSTEGGWRIMEPNPTIVPFHRMWDRVSMAAASIMNEHTVVAQPTDLAQYGLDIPALTVIIETTDEMQFHLRFGDLEPTQRHRYARLDDGPLFLIDKDMFFELNRSLLDLRHRFLVNHREAELEEIEFAWIWTGEEDPSENVPKSGEESIPIIVNRASPQAPWKMTAPVIAPANHEAVQALAEDLQFAVCDAFIDNPEDLRDYGLKPPRARITMEDAENGMRQTVFIGNPDASPDHKGLFVQREGEDAVMIIDGHLLTLLPQSPFQWRDLRLLTRRVTDINQLDYNREGDYFSLKKSETGEWRLASPEIEEINSFAVSGFLRFFKEVAGDEFVKDEALLLALESPEVRIGLQYEDGEKAEIMLTPAPDEAGEYLATQDTGGVVRLSGIAVRMLLANSETFRSREMLRFVKAEPQELRFVFDAVEYELAVRHGVWTLLRPETMQLHNQADVNTLLEAITPLHAVSIVELTTPENVAQYGLDAPLFTIEIQSDDWKQSMELHIGDSNPDNPNERFAWSSEREGVYLVSQEVMDEIREALRGIR